MILHGYFRSSASWRVRIALALKGVDATSRVHHLRRGEQRNADYLALNPQGLLPALEIDDGRVLTQSLAIIAYLDELYPQPPLLPARPFDRAFVRSIALAIACDIHPVQNLRVLGRVTELADAAAATEWARAVIVDGLDACEVLLTRVDGPFCLGDTPTVADICLVPQLANARRFGADGDWPRLFAAEAACLALPAFADTRPERQPDAE